MDILDNKRLAECRIRHGITKQEAAKWIQVSQPAYLRYEAGTRNPSIQVISKMAEAFSTSVDYLVGKSNEDVSDIITIERGKSPTVFDLYEVCKDLDNSKLNRVISYAKKIANSSDS